MTATTAFSGCGKYDGRYRYRRYANTASPYLTDFAVGECRSGPVIQPIQTAKEYLTDFGEGVLRGRGRPSLRRVSTLIDTVGDRMDIAKTSSACYTALSRR